MICPVAFGLLEGWMRRTEQRSDAGARRFERTFTCHHLVQREGEQLKIGLTTCQGQVRL